MDEIDIQPADDAEREIAAGLLAGSEPWITLGITREQCDRNCHDAEYQLYIAKIHGEPAGIIILDPRGVAGSPYIKSIAVFPEYRGRGVGSGLLSYVESLSGERSKHIFICVSSFNHRARKLYERCGYEFAGEFKDYIIDGASEILMHKRL